MKSTRWQQAAVTTQDRGYPFKVARVPDAEWVSQFEAARELGIGGFRVGVGVLRRALVFVTDGLKGLINGI